ncbi:Hypothetical predicted protein [Mytilus galloprovincialis]|uniref:Uncharacterized protein n=1 Tax=Mytilus galloprovincialis TaxID=29158 RepID=A0A8B6H0J9_MYTGA|nr:Hypothetical predicted protein [Mytilus galloprovincialis]
MFVWQDKKNRIKNKKQKPKTKDKQARFVDVQDAELLSKDQLKRIKQNRTCATRVSGKRKHKLLKRIRHQQKEKIRMDNPPPHPIDEFSAEDFRKLIDLNVVSYFLFSKYALPYLRLTEGSIINISSLVGNIGQGQAVTYCATKGAITSMTKALAIDEAKYNVRVNSISPSNIWTPLFDSYLKTCPESEEVKKGFENNQLLGRFGTIQEIGQACLFLAADATFCTGIEINMSAGAELNYANKNMRPKAS